MTLKAKIIIPARYGSTRFPGKPLASVAGVPLLQRVWAIGVSVLGKDGAAVATDDERIAEFCAKIGAECVMTSTDAANGTERVRDALAQMPADVEAVLNLQGDAVLTPPWVVRAVLDAMTADSSVEIATPAVKMSRNAYDALRQAKAGGEVGGTTVVFDNRRDALYFSKSVIPFVRDNSGDDIPAYRHIGLYAYRRAALDRLTALPAGVLENSEKLEQLRALENGMKIRVAVVDYRGRSHTGIDSEADLRRAERIIAAEGELLPAYDGTHRELPVP